MSSTIRRIFSVVVAAGALFAGAGPIACNEEEGSGTTGRRVALDVKIAADSKELTNAKGWKIVLGKAVVSTGPLYFYDGETLFAGAAPRPRFELVRSAFAHPGHYVPGNAKGELRTASSIDLLAGASLGAGDGVTGLVQSATFSFGAPATGPLAAELGPNVVVLEGTATKDVETRPFRAEILADDVKNDKGAPQVEGCPFVRADVQGDGVVTITVKVSQWLDQVDFTDVPKSEGGTPVVMTAGLARNQLVRGMKGGLAYVFAFAPR